METSFSVELYHAMANASFSRSDKIYFSANWSEGKIYFLNTSYYFLLCCCRLLKKCAGKPTLLIARMRITLCGQFMGCERKREWAGSCLVGG